MIFERGHFDSNAVKESFVNESLSEMRMYSATKAKPTKPTVFLSHKHDDLKDMMGFMGKLQGFGVKVYIDSMDNRMPNQTNGDTAKRIKQVIEGSNKFILLATDKAIESYWCNWELGIGDTYKFIEHIAILPMKDKGSYDSSFKGNEYLQIYPVIEYLDGTTKSTHGNRISQGYYVKFPVNSEGTHELISLEKWLN